MRDGGSDSGTHGLNALGTMLLEVGDLVEQTLQAPLFLGLHMASGSLRRSWRWVRRRTMRACNSSSSALPMSSPDCLGGRGESYCKSRAARLRAIFWQFLLKSPSQWLSPDAATIDREADGLTVDRRCSLPTQRGGEFRWLFVALQRHDAGRPPGRGVCSVLAGPDFVSIC